MIAHAGWANSSSDRSPGSTGAFLAATSEGGANRSRAARPWRFAAGWAEEATEAGAGSSAGGAVAGRPRLRLLVASRENPAPAVNSQSTSTTMAIRTPFRRPECTRAAGGCRTRANPGNSDSEDGLVHYRAWLLPSGQQPRTITRHRARW